MLVWSLRQTYWVCKAVGRQGVCTRHAGDWTKGKKKKRRKVQLKRKEDSLIKCLLSWSFFFFIAHKYFLLVIFLMGIDWLSWVNQIMYYWLWEKESDEKRERRQKRIWDKATSKFVGYITCIDVIGCGNVTISSTGHMWLVVTNTVNTCTKRMNANSIGSDWR